MLSRALMALFLMASGCDALNLEGPDQHCGELEPPYERLLEEKRYTGKVYGGTVEPTVVPLAPEQLPAIGSLGMCTGTLIAQRWVLTAAHCEITPGHPFCMGAQHDLADVCIPSARVFAHPLVDLALIELVDDAERWMPGVQPIPVIDEILQCERLGQMAEAAGYGTSPNVSFGVRFFAAEHIIGLTRDYVSLHGMGRKGMCRGDSGAPVMVVASDGSTRVAGALNGGDASCRGRDDFARVDVMQSWLEGFTGSMRPPGPSRF